MSGSLSDSVRVRVDPGGGGLPATFDTQLIQDLKLDHGDIRAVLSRYPYLFDFNQPVVVAGDSFEAAVAAVLTDKSTHGQLQPQLLQAAAEHFHSFENLVDEALSGKSEKLPLTPAGAARELGDLICEGFGEGQDCPGQHLCCNRMVAFEGDGLGNLDPRRIIQYPSTAYEYVILLKSYIWFPADLCHHLTSVVQPMIPIKQTLYLLMGNIPPFRSQKLIVSTSQCGDLATCNSCLYNLHSSC